MSDVIVIDTDVIIDYLRAQPDAVAYLEGLENEPMISTVTVAELYSNVRDGTERANLDSFIDAMRVVAVDQDIAVQGGLFRRAYYKSHGVQIPDALIAATAVLRSATMVTLNKKHFPMLSAVLVPYRKP